jgi:hypothetical protein
MVGGAVVDQIYKVRDPSGNIREIKGPAGATDEQVIEQAKVLFAPRSRADLIPGNLPDPPPPAPTSLLDRAGGVREAALSVVTGIPAMLAGGVAGGVMGVGDTLLRGQQAGNETARQTAQNVSQALTFRPRTPAGQDALDQFGKLMDASKLGGLPPSQGVSAAAMAPTATRQAIGNIPSLPTREGPGMAGMGAAMTDIERLRWERAQALPVPLPLTKGMRSRDFEQQRFERETAKDGKFGAPIRERHAELNASILKNFDSFLDGTGAEAGGLRAVGEIVNTAVVNKARMAKGHVDAAYQKARESGEMQAPVDVRPILQYVESHRPEAINAPIIASLEAKLNAVARKDAQGNVIATINDLEEVREMVGNLSGKDATNAHFGKEIKGLIDGLTENAGGQEYKRARALRFKYGKEFEDIGVIDKLLSNKPGTRDRAVAYEDVFKHSILSGSLDDVRHVRRTLQTAGPEGQQAWKELQGQTVQHIKDEVTKSATTDVKGNTVVSADKLNRVITELDKDGKLDFVFGKTGGQQMREIREAARDILTFPPGSVNTSGTASVLLEAVGSAALGRLPTAAAQAIAGLQRARRSFAMKRRVKDALEPPTD